MITSYNDLMFIGQTCEEKSEPFEFFAARHPGEISSLDEDISWRQVLNLDLLVLIMRVRYGNDSYGSTLLVRQWLTFCFHNSLD